MELFLAIAFGATLVVEIILSGTWDGFYFRYGVPLFRRSLGQLQVGRISTRWLNDRWSSLWALPLRFHRLSGSEIAVREAMMSFGLLCYTPVMHGLIRGDVASGEAVLVGRANWWPALLWLWFSASDLEALFTDGVVGDLAAPLFALLVLGVIYAIQWQRYRHLAAHIVERFAGPPATWWREEEAEEDEQDGADRGS